jgi:hypothetical protein
MIELHTSDTSVARSMHRGHAATYRTCSGTGVDNDYRHAPTAAFIRYRVNLRTIQPSESWVITSSQVPGSGRARGRTARTAHAAPHTAHADRTRGSRHAACAARARPGALLGSRVPSLASRPSGLCALGVFYINARARHASVALDRHAVPVFSHPYIICIRAHNVNISCLGGAVPARCQTLVVGSQQVQTK